MKAAVLRHLFAVVLFTGGSHDLALMAQAAPLILTLKATATIGDSVIGTDIQVADGLAYIAWLQLGTNPSGGLQIIAVTNSSNPAPVGGYNSCEPVNAVQVVRRYAYLAEGSARTQTNDPGVLEIIDVSNPANPVRVGSISTLGRANEIRVAGNFAYVAEGTRWTGSNLLGALEIFDISAATNPIRVATFDTAGSATSVDVSGGYAYLADGVTDLQVLDVSDPGHPWRAGIYQPDLSRCAFEPLGPANDVQVVGDLAYSSGDNGLNVLDISDPSQPVRVLDNTCIPIYRLHLAGHYAFLVTYRSSLNAFYLTISDTTHPTNWVTVGAQANWPPVRMHVVSNLIYLATNPLEIHEISDAPSIKSISRSGGSLILTWEGVPGFTLQSTASLSDPEWTDVPGSSGQTRIELPLGGDEFFRLFKPPWTE